MDPAVQAAIKRLEAPVRRLESKTKGAPSRWEKPECGGGVFWTRELLGEGSLD
jgi:hypothetical protein